MTALSTSLVSRIVGYKITKGDFRLSSPNLPMRIAILGEANADNQSSLDTDGTAVTTAQRAGELYGFGSPIYHIMRILRPISGDGVAGIPTVVYAQEEASGATARVVEVTPSGVATGNGIHTVKVAGRDGLDGQSYDISIETGDEVSDITAKIETALNAVLGCPVTASDTTYEVELTTKWKGLTAQSLDVEVDTNDNDLGITYTVTETQAGSGTPEIADALTSFGNDWNTIVVNGYSTVTAILSALESFNGIPDPDNPTGRYAAAVMKPFIAITGSTADDPSSITDARADEVTVAIAPAPLSKGFPFEAAANAAYLFANRMQDNPHLDISGQSYPDMPTPTSIGSMATYANRDAMVKKGCSTVDLVSGAYQIQDFVTTYHPTGEIPPQFRYCRNLMGVDMNVRYSYYLMEQTNVLDHVIANDADIVSASNVIKPKQLKGLIGQMAEDLEDRGLIVDSDFTADSTTVDINDSNPDRLDVFFRYKRTGTVRIASTTAQAGFNFGNV